MVYRNQNFYTNAFEDNGDFNEATGLMGLNPYAQPANEVVQPAPSRYNISTPEVSAQAFAAQQPVQTAQQIQPGAPEPYLDDPYKYGYPEEPMSNIFGNSGLPTFTAPTSTPINQQVVEPYQAQNNIITEDPIREAIGDWGSSAVPLAKLNNGSEPATPAPQPIGQALPALQSAIQPGEPAPTTQDAQQTTGVFGLPSLQPAQPAQPAPQPAPVQTGPAPETIDALSQQILGQGLTGKWTGEGYGSAEKNAADMAKILAGIGITDIKQFGKIPQYETQTQYKGQQVNFDEDGNPYVMALGGGLDDYGNPMPTRQTVDPKQLEQVQVKTGDAFGNKVTGQIVPNTYSERQKDNFWGGTFAGKGNTGYGVQFDSQGNPIFYTQGASSNDLANIMKDLGPVGQIALAAATGGMSLPAQLATNAAVQLLAGGNLKDIVKGTALSYLGGQAGNLISGSNGITDLLGQTGSDIASKAAQQYVGSGGKADIGQALLGGAINTGVNSAIGDIPGLEDLSGADKRMASNLITAVATGTPIEQAIQNAVVGRASAEVSGAAAKARNEPAPQTYEDLMASIMPKMPDQPSEDKGPSNDEILKQIGYEPPAPIDVAKPVEPPTVEPEPANLDALLRSLQPYAEPTQEGRTLPEEKPQITEEPLPTPVPFNIDKLLGELPTQQEQPAVDNLINKSSADTLGTKTENAAEPATGKEKTMDEDIDYGQIPGDYGNSIADEIAKLANSGNASSLFSGDGGEDVSKLLSDQPYQFDPNDYRDAFASGNLGATNPGYYDEITGNFIQDPNGGLLSPLTNDVGNIDPESKWEYSQTKPGVWKNDKGEEIDLSYLPNTQKTMTGAEIMKKAGVSPAGSSSSNKTSTSKSTATSPGTSNTGLIMALMAMMAMMNNKGSGSSAASSIPALAANRSQLPYAPVGRPGAGGVNYFSPTTYTAKAAEGGLMGLAGGGMSNLGGYSDGGRLLRGPGDGVSDSIPATISGKQPARLATGEFVVPARIVSELGNGSTDAGAKRLYDMMDRVQNARRKTKNVAADTKAHKYLPS